ncbi:MAG: type II toxin-antitoxin system RelE/ParE family toxin [Oscillospiraceae bacterium]|nr:type II toxin-antitoxin system RelE/ParE family toxin [Oscillospiraceae bacterium]
MKHYTVMVTEGALEDMEEIYNYIASVLLSPENARRQYNRIVDAIFTLEEMPERYKQMDFDFARQKGLRRMLVDNYSVIYAVKGESVFITNVIYSASDIETRLGEKK